MVMLVAQANVCMPQSNGCVSDMEYILWTGDRQLGNDWRALMIPVNPGTNAVVVYLRNP